MDYHSCGFFPERWFDLVVVLRTSNSVLYHRLAARSYSAKKIDENIQCEIMQVILDEARESYDPDIIVELLSDSADDLENNLNCVRRWLSDNWNISS